jgi:hypothetical protein
MQANSVQHKVMTITVRIFFRKPVFFVMVYCKEKEGLPALRNDK